MHYGRVFVLLFGLVTSLSAFADSGIAMSSTRVIYNADKKEAAMTVQNRGKTSAYLVQSWIDDANEKKNPAFVVTPPLFRIEPGKENMLRIVRIGGTLPEDRESIFWLNVKAIPPAAQADANTLQLAIKTRMKLFYRPAGLKGNPADAYKQLVWSASGGKVQVSNSSPYNVVLAQVNISGKEVKNDLVDFVPAKGTLNITLPANTNAGPGSKVAFKIISDFGGNSGPYNASVQ